MYFFMPLLSVLPRRTINPQALYEFVHTEAVFGGRTPVIEIDLLPPDSLVRIGNRIAVTKQPSALAPGERSGSFDDFVQETASTLRRYFRSLARAFGNNFGCALSGGYDSRLILALLKDAGLVPRVHVYGPDHHPDVVIAKEIAAGEGLDFRHVNKSRFPCLTIDQFPAVVADNFLKFDGFPSDGIMDNGSDLQTRLERFEGGRLMLHGGCGEIYRNNTYLFDFDFTVRQFVDAFLTRGVDPRRCTRRFSARAYADEIGKAIKDLLPAPQDRLKRCEIEYLMACFWWRFWHGANINVENRFGYFMMPFGDYQLVRDALQIPIRYKYFGRFSAQLIKVIDHRLASYRSTYGHSPAHGPPPWRRAQELVNLLRPTWTRRYSYRVKNWTAPARPRLPYWLSEPYLATVLDLRFPIMSEFFVIERVKDIKSYNRICTLEMLFSRMNVGMP